MADKLGINLLPTESPVIAVDYFFTAAAIRGEMPYEGKTLASVVAYLLDKEGRGPCVMLTRELLVE